VIGLGLGEGKIEREEEGTETFGVFSEEVKRGNSLSLLE
jgi:hypothetical protein